MAEQLQVLEDRNWYLERLRNGRCEVDFTKKDGTKRKMVCTLNMDLIPGDHHPKSDGNSTSQTNGSIRVYDFEKEAWRSFRVESVDQFNPL